MELPGSHPLKGAQKKLDEAVRAAYGMSATADALTFLLKLNEEVAEAEAKGMPVQAPGIPACVKDPTKITTTTAFACDLAVTCRALLHLGGPTDTPTVGPT